jgi:hypothetical protein
VIAACEAAGDRLHLCAAVNNRMFLWSARGALDRARADLGRARRLARELGYPMPERRATYNLAEDLHWSGDDPDRALALARRSLALARRYIPTPVAADALLVARILVDRGEDDEARELLRHAQACDLTRTEELLARAVELALDRAEDGWDALWREAEAALSGDDALEIAYLRARCRESEAADVAASAAPLVARYPIWRARFADLTARRTVPARGVRRNRPDRSASRSPRSRSSRHPCKRSA